MLWHRRTQTYILNAVANRPKSALSVHALSYVKKIYNRITFVISLHAERIFVSLESFDICQISVLTNIKDKHHHLMDYGKKLHELHYCIVWPVSKLISATTN